MTRSYAFIFTGVTFRLGLMVLPLLGLSFDTAYPVSAWIAWPINLALAEVLLRRRRRPFQAGAAAHMPAARTPADEDVVAIRTARSASERSHRL
jgi:hypothetical protein